MSNFDFIDATANRLSISPFDRSKVIAAAVALVAAYRAPVPSSAVGSIDNYFRDHVVTALTDLVGEMSECCVLDFKFAREIAEAFWRIRYNAAMNPQFPFITDDIGIVDQIVGAGTYLAKDTHCFLNDNKKAILTIALPVWNCVKECEAADNGETANQFEAVLGSGVIPATEDNGSTASQTTGAPPASTASQTPEDQTAGKATDTASETSDQGNAVSQESSQEPTGSASIKSNFNKVISLLKEVNPEQAKKINEALDPITEEQLEKISKVKSIPDGVRSLLKISNGPVAVAGGKNYDFFGQYALMDHQDIISALKHQIKIKGEVDERINASKSTDWFPFAADGRGNFLYVDTNPGKGGSSGQVIEYDHSNDHIKWIATSVAAHYAISANFTLKKLNQSKSL